MGSTKDWMMDMNVERMIEWMRKNYDLPENDEIDEEYPGFEEMAEMYQHELDREDYEANMQWFMDHAFLEAYSVFIDQLKFLKLLVRQHAGIDDSTIQRMAYAHAVTLFEAMVGDMLKSALLNYPHMMDRFVCELEKDKSLKFTIKEVAEFGVNGIVINIINDQVFHNPVTVKRYVELVAGRVLPDTQMAEIRKIIAMRHDFVHRNGKTVSGEPHLVGAALVIDSIEVIEKFAEDVFETLSDAAAKGDS